MKRTTKIKSLIAGLLVIFAINTQAQTKVYAVTGGELLFQWADLSLKSDYMTANPNDQLVDNPLRFTAFFHIGQYINMDFSDNFGLYTGLAFRNVGYISDERLNMESAGIQDYKIIRRYYTLGLPIAFKVGSFKNHTFLFAGGEIEWAYVYKQKYWNSHSRSGPKTKEIDWFGPQANDFIPSVFAGVQFPGGVNVKFKYYLENFINNNYSNQNKVSDLTRYDKTQVMYVSLSYMINTSKFTKAVTPKEKITSL